VANPFDEGNPFDEPEGGASGDPGGSEPVKPLAKAPLLQPEDPALAKEKAAQVMSSLAHGQGAPPEGLEDRTNKLAGGALGEGIAMARGAPLVGAHIDELSALLQTHAANGPEYEKKRNEARTAVDKAVSDNPSLPTIGSLAFAPAIPGSALGRLGLSFAAGASEGAGAAENMSKVPRAAALGGGIGLGAGLAGEALLAGGRFLGGKQAAVAAKNKANTDKLIDEAFQSSAGSVGGNSAAGANLIRARETDALDMRLPEEVRADAAKWLDSPEALKLREQVARARMTQGPDKLRELEQSFDALDEARRAMSPESREAAAQARLNDPSALLRRVRELGPKIALPIVGATLGGPVGAGAGALGGAVMGRSATTVRNALADPFVASRVLGVGAGVLNAAGRSASAAAPAASRSALEPYLKALQRRDEEAPWQLLAGGSQ
jgi:hypothetical protein